MKSLLPWNISRPGHVCSGLTLHVWRLLILKWRHNGARASQFTSRTIVYSTVYSGVDQRKHQSTASLAFCVGNSPVTGKWFHLMTSSWCRHDKNENPNNFISQPCVSIIENITHPNDTRIPHFPIFNIMLHSWYFNTNLKNKNMS